MFYTHGPKNGTFLGLPFDQLVEHGPGHVTKWERSADPRAVIELAKKGNFSAIALPIGLAEKYQVLIKDVQMPLIVKVDGHFLVGKDVKYPRHSTMSGVERAIEAGANAIGCTFYIGGEETEQDVERVAQITEIAHKNEKPVFMWAYARGPLPDAMGADSLFWCAYGILAAEAIGADVVKQKFPALITQKNRGAYEENLKMGGYFYKGTPEVEELLKLEPKSEISSGDLYDLHVKRLAFLASIAPNTLKIISGGPKSEDEEGLYKTLRMVMDSGNEGQIVGRNLWGRPTEKAVEIAKRMTDIIREEQYHRKNEANNAQAGTGYEKNVIPDIEEEDPMQRDFDARMADYVRRTT